MIFCSVETYNTTNSDALSKLAEEKSKAYKIYKKNREDRLLFENYQKLCVRVKKEARRAQKKYHSKLLDESRGDPGKYWSIINKVGGNQRSQLITELEIDGEIVKT